MEREFAPFARAMNRTPNLLLALFFVASGCGLSVDESGSSPTPPTQGEHVTQPGSPDEPGSQPAPPSQQPDERPLTRADLPQVLFSEPEALLAARVEARSGTVTRPALLQLKANAEQALSAGPFTVMHKPQTAPTGDKHDYLSLGRYWWPDPDQPDGLPYMQVDGQVNPETLTIPDKPELQELIPTVSTLSHAWFVFGDERYAQHAAHLLRTWFLDPETRMNPNLEYSQIHKGHTDELGGSGIIDARDFATIPGTVGLLKTSSAWTAEDESQLREWFSEYLDWYLNSPGGREEAATTNNHVTFYWYQALPLLIYTGQDQLVDETLTGLLTSSLEDQVAEDGSQPRELDRSKPFSYSVFNLMAWSRIAMLAEERGIDLWNHEGPDGNGSLRKAFAFLLPYLSGEEEIVDDPNVPERPRDFARVLHRAAVKLQEPTWAELAKSAMGDESALLELDLIVAPETK